MTEPSAIVVHSLPHRVRLRFPERQGHVSYFDALADSLRNTDGIERVKANPRTSSLVLEFSCGFDALVALLREHGVDVRLQTIHRGALSRTASTESSMKPVSIVTGRNIDPMFMAGTAFALLGVIQALRGRILVPSVTALWYACEAFVRSGRPKQG